ncbi:cap-specific mRNA (nucleoside-2'-O-)-methyltransferase 1-like protein [Leptotrombidium deliense]|uniref:Cap-specific mRNA (nucleoside-2'-O-)-methyltransferase 1 n=1 Tax=Leptotrombidium deliense TaxID=299467 RepID=A0A443SE66_9ACAR|nr:cap-specific mRNA (nucleoside-2'-O-)-methyltransferase 1-like protein [Leptotrombidium deliense]
MFRRLMGRSPAISNKKFFATKPQELTPKLLKDCMKFPRGFRLVVLSASADECSNPKYFRGFFLSLGGNNIRYWSGVAGDKWWKVKMELQLPAETLVYGEKVKEVRGEGEAQRHKVTFHIIDALFLGGIDVRLEKFDERISMINKLVKAVTKTSIVDRTSVRIKKVYDLVEIHELFDDFEMKEMKSGIIRERLCHRVKDAWFTRPSGVLIMNGLKKPWVCKMSHSKQRIYYFNSKDDNSMFVFPKEAIADFKTSFCNSFIWKWSSDECLLETNTKRFDSSQVTRTTFMAHIRKMLQKTKEGACYLIKFSLLKMLDNQEYNGLP